MLRTSSDRESTPWAYDTVPPKRQKDKAKTIYKKIRLVGIEGHPLTKGIKEINDLSQVKLRFVTAPFGS
jgi:hypothetical protein